MATQRIQPFTTYTHAPSGRTVLTGSARIVYRLSSVRGNPDAGPCVRVATLGADGRIVPESRRLVPVRALAPA